MVHLGVYIKNKINIFAVNSRHMSSVGTQDNILKITEQKQNLQTPIVIVGFNGSSKVKHRDVKNINHMLMNYIFIYLTCADAAIKHTSCAVIGKDSVRKDFTH